MVNEVQLVAESLDDFTGPVELGRGNGGSVHRIEDSKQRGRYYARKDYFLTQSAILPNTEEEIRKQKIAQQWAVRSTLTELAIMMHLRLPSMVPLHRIFVENGTVSAIMGLMDATLTDLYTAVRNGGKKYLNEEDARFLIYDIVVAVEHLHSWNIAHRDLKMDNILIKGGRAVVSRNTPP